MAVLGSDSSRSRSAEGAKPSVFLGQVTNCDQSLAQTFCDMAAGMHL
jgi:hypothetical protein